MEVQAGNTPEAKTTPGSNPNPGGDGDPGKKTTNGQDPDGQRAKGDDGDSGKLDYSDPDATKAEIERLRKENAKYRTKSKDLETNVSSLTERFSKLETGLKTLFGGEDEKLTPEQRLEAVQQRNEQLELQAALREASVEYDIPAAQFDYFEFLISKELSALKDGEELSDEKLEEIAKKVKSITASSNTSVDGKGGNPNPSKKEDGITLEEFKVMGITERSRLYQQDQARYEKLKAQEDAAHQR